MNKFIILILAVMFILPLASASLCYKEDAESTLCNSLPGSYYENYTTSTNAEYGALYRGSNSTTSANLTIKFANPAIYRNFSIVDDCISNGTIQMIYHTSHADSGGSSINISCYNWTSGKLYQFNYTLLGTIGSLSSTTLTPKWRDGDWNTGLWYYGTEWYSAPLTLGGAFLYEEGIYFDIGNSFIEDNQSYSSRVLESESSSFKLNFTYSDFIYSVNPSAVLVYNGTSYSSTLTFNNGTYVEATALIDIPINEINSYMNKSFYWDVSLTSTYQTYKFNSTSNTQEVINTNISYCGTPTPTETLNISVKDELTGLFISPSIDAILTWRTSNLSEVTRNNSFALSGANSYRFCLSYNSSYYTDIDLQMSLSGYEDKLYSIRNLILSNVSQTYYLYMLNNSYSTRVIVILKDSGLAPLVGYSTKMYKKDLSTNNWVLNSEDVTDLYGQTIVYVIENSERYKFKFYDSDGNLVKETGEMSIACRTAICTLPFVVSATIDEYDKFDSIDNYVYSLTYVNTSNSFIFTWSDTTGDSPTHRLEVIRRSFNETVVICNSTSTSLSSSLSCDLTDRVGTYYAYGIRTASPGRWMVTIQKTFDEAYRTFWKEGLFWSFILLMTMLLIGAWSPIVGVVLYLVGFISIGLFGGIYIDPAIVIAQLVMGGIFAWAFRG